MKDHMVLIIIIFLFMTTFAMIQNQNTRQEEPREQPFIAVTGNVAGTGEKTEQDTQRAQTKAPTNKSNKPKIQPTCDTTCTPAGITCSEDALRICQDMDGNGCLDLTTIECIYGCDEKQSSCRNNENSPLTSGSPDPRPNGQGITGSLIDRRVFGIKKLRTEVQDIQPAQFLDKGEGAIKKEVDKEERVFERKRLTIAQSDLLRQPIILVETQDNCTGSMQGVIQWNPDQSICRRNSVNTPVSGYSTILNCCKRFFYQSSCTKNFGMMKRGLVMSSQFFAVGCYE